jgi:hypothetical protein
LLGVSVSDATVLHLTLADYVHELDAAQRDPGATKILEAEHRTRASLDRPMVLLDNIVQILVLANLIGVSRSAFRASSAARFAPLLSIVTVSGRRFA